MCIRAPHTPHAHCPVQLQPPSRIREHLYLGNGYNAVNFVEMRSLGVTHVLNVCAEDRFDPPEATYDSLGIYCHRIALVDHPSQPILPHFDDALRFLAHVHAVGGICLAHCEYGVSR